MKNKKIKIAFSIFFFALLCGCNSEIDLVKNGTLSGYEQTTIGKAFESSFGDVKWKYFETSKGVKIVEFNGLPGRDFFTSNDNFQKIQQCKDPQKAVVQFALHANSNSFDVLYCGWGETSLSCKRFLNYVYSNDSKYEPLKKYCPNYSSMTDSRDQKKYRTTIIGKKEWMAENLNYDNGNSFCYENAQNFCDKYGWRYYTRDAAAKVCPKGWHLPKKMEMKELIASVGGENVAGKKLKSVTKDWSETYSAVWTKEWEGIDEFGFDARPAGYVVKNGDGQNYYAEEGKTACFWGGNMENDGFVVLIMEYSSKGASIKDSKEFFKYYACSVRCVKD
jgi:uncharacterized protein (TIGR02145 family)